MIPVDLPSLTFGATFTRNRPCYVIRLATATLRPLQQKILWFLSFTTPTGLVRTTLHMPQIDTNGIFSPEMTHEEVVLIKQWDSAGAFAASKGSEWMPVQRSQCSLNFHSAFEDPHTKEDAPDRRSIEVRCIAIY